MINLIYGAKGSGKTKRIIELSNEAANTSGGSVAFIGDQARYSNQISTKVRYADYKEYAVADFHSALGFVKGILASNYDITHFFIDGVTRLTGSRIEDLKQFFIELEVLSAQDNVSFTLTISAADVPPYLKKYL